jgi:hypothetical protein
MLPTTDTAQSRASATPIFLKMERRPSTCKAVKPKAYTFQPVRLDGYAGTDSMSDLGAAYGFEYSVIVSG